ncbi:MAG: hypothetical protein HYV02_05430 [Deltaproteobacteria bacterium]|nr:hypothetical protein [Deltaproteobacteria bacterium]
MPRLSVQHGRTPVRYDQLRTPAFRTTRLECLTHDLGRLVGRGSAGPVPLPRWPACAGSMECHQLGTPQVGFAPHPHLLDVMREPHAVLMPPADRHVHLDFEAGRGAYATALARTNPEKHFVAIDDGGLVFPVSDDATAVERGRYTIPRLRRHIGWTGTETLHYHKPDKAWTAALQREITRLDDVKRICSSDYRPREWLGFWRSMLHHQLQLGDCELQWGKIAYDGYGRRLQEQYPRWLRGLRAYCTESATAALIDDIERVCQGCVQQSNTRASIHHADLLAALLVLSGLFLHFQPDDSAQALPGNLSVIRAPTALETEFGHTGIPLPGASVDTISWIGPFGHHDDMDPILGEFARILRTDWLFCDVAVLPLYAHVDVVPDLEERLAARLGAEVTMSWVSTANYPGLFSEHSGEAQHQLYHCTRMKRSG